MLILQSFGVTGERCFALWFRGTCWLFSVLEALEDGVRGERDGGAGGI